MSSQVHQKRFKKPFNKFHKNGNNPFGKKPFGNKPFGHKPRSHHHHKKRLFPNVNGFGKNGKFGTGAQIEEKDFTFFMGILETQQNIFQSLDDKVNIASNVMEHTISKEVHFSSNQVACRVIENSMGFVDGEHLERFFDTFGEDFRSVILNFHASHILQKMIEIAFLRSAGKLDAPEEEGASAPKKARKEIITDLKYNTTHDFTEEHRTKCGEFIVSVAKFLLDNLEDFVEDRHGNHIVRSVILALAGVHIPKTKKFKKGKKVPISDKYDGRKSGHHQGIFMLGETLFKVPDEWIEVLKGFPEKLQEWPQFKDFPYKFRTSGLFQVICIALRTADKKSLINFGNKLVSDAFIDVEIPESPYHERHTPKDDNEDADNNGDIEEETNGNEDDEESKPEPIDVDESGEDEDEDEQKETEKVKGKEEVDDDEEKPSVFKSDASVHLLHTLIAVAPPKLLKKIFELFNDRLLSLAKAKRSNATVERMINYVVEKSHLEVIFNELSPHFEKFIQEHKPNLMSALSGACLRLKELQAPFVTAVQEALHCSASQGEERPKSFFLCLTKLKPFEVLPYDKHKYVKVCGSLVVQDILCFNKPISMVNCILETPVKDVIDVLQSQYGSYIADKFLTSPTINEKSREKFVKLFEGFYINFSVSKPGSLILETLMKSANDEQKVVIANELTGKDNKLKAAFFGRVLYNTLRLEMFKLNAEQWKNSWTSEGTAAIDADSTVEEDEENPTVEEIPEETTATVPKSGKKNKKNKKRPAS